MSLIVELGVSLLLLLRVPRRHALWICVGPIVFYTAAVGGDPPVLRAALMAGVGLLTAALSRDIPRYYPLFLAAGAILLFTPEALLGASFQLSFGATLSILVLLPLWEDLDPGRERWRRWMLSAGLMGLAVHIGIWPFSALLFSPLVVGRLFGELDGVPARREYNGAGPGDRHLGSVRTCGKDGAAVSNDAPPYRCRDA